MGSRGDLVARLAAVHDALSALPADAFAERHELLLRQDALREEAAQYAVDLDAQRPEADLLSELAALRSQLSVLEGQKIDLVTQAGAASAGEMGNLGGVELNAKMMEATGANRIQARIGVIKGVLGDRGVEVPQAR